MGKGVPWSEKESAERIIWRKLDEWWHRPKFGVRWREKWGFHLPCWSLRKSRREWVLVAIVKQVSAQLPPRLALGHRAPDEKVIQGFYFYPLPILGSCCPARAGWGRDTVGGKLSLVISVRHISPPTFLSHLHFIIFQSNIHRRLCLCRTQVHRPTPN